MKLFKSAIKYFKGKGLYLVLISLLPSILVPFLMSPSNSFYYLFDFQNIQTNSFAELFVDIRLLPTRFFYVGIIGIILEFLVISVLFAVVDRHMRVGDFTLDFSRTVKGINYNILPSILYILLLAVISEILSLISTSFYYLWAKVLSDSPGGWFALSFITYFGLAFLNLMAFAVTILFPPFIIHTGLPIHEAFKMAIRNVSKHVSDVAKSLLIMIVPFFVVAIIIGIIGAVIGFDHLGIKIARVALDGVTFGVMVPFFVTLMYTLFYDVTGTERMDLEKVNIWKKGK